MHDMTSESYSQRKFLSTNTCAKPTKSEKHSTYKYPTVYDAVAGRISVSGFIPAQPAVASTRDTASSSRSALPPESVLFKSKNAPTRYIESDIYFTNERKNIPELPSSDLLKALHTYTSDFYSRVASDSGSASWKSLDETALIALGILMEELCRTSLGSTGDLSFTEAEILEEKAPSNAQAGPNVLSIPRPLQKKRRIS